MKHYDYTPDFIQELAPDEIFVFGSDPKGEHTGGGARIAIRNFGAIMGVGHGRQGQCYAIPTKQCTMDEIKKGVDDFVEYAKKNPELTFLLTKVGCGMAGYSADDMAPLFTHALDVENIVLPKEFADILEAGKPREKYYLDLIKGSIIGGAAGDALGYAVEFMRLDDIIDDYGPEGITKFRIREGDCALISDDTQMTLFTAGGILGAFAAGQRDRQSMLASIKDAYLEWYGTQAGRDEKTPNKCWLASVPALNHRRAPGGTCMSALHDIHHGKEADNYSKGCGGVMRIAPIALLGAAQGMDIEDVDWLAAEAARLTHKHPFGYLPALLAAHIIYYSVLHPVLPKASDIEKWLADGFSMARKLYSNDCPSALQNLKGVMDGYLEVIHDTTLSDREAIGKIGEGWVGEEAFGIALCSVLRHIDDFGAALIMSVNHNGDSDSTGSITGNMLGAVLGYSHLTEKFKHNIEAHDLLMEVSNMLNNGVTK